MNFNFPAIVKYIPQMLHASITTIELVVLSCAVGLVFGVVLGLLRLSKNPLIYGLPYLYGFFFRGSPLLVQMFLIYYGLGQFDSVKASVLWKPVLSKAYWCAIIAFTMNTSAYIAEIVKGAIESIPNGELEAADAIGMSKWQKLKHIILPRAFGIMLPAYSNEVIFMIKGSALAATITALDLMEVTRKIAAKTYLHTELYIAAGVIYLLLVWVFLAIAKGAERLINRHKYYKPNHQSTTA